ncbi:hypothetical protein GGR58DRAFT_439712 [Xylaria digitata]|nr:hypothetical protein GGR58DRAFT_439712 [Xylaria digitata]
MYTQRALALSLPTYLGTFLGTVPNLYPSPKSLPFLTHTTLKSLTTLTSSPPPELSSLSPPSVSSSLPIPSAYPYYPIPSTCPCSFAFLSFTLLPPIDDDIRLPVFPPPRRFVAYRALRLVNLRSYGESSD